MRDVGIHGRLLSELQLYQSELGTREINEPVFPTRTGTRRDKDNVRRNIVNPVVRRANELRISREQPPIHLHVTPHTFRRTYITYMLAGGHDIPYVQSQVGHEDPATTLGIYARLIRRPDREQLRHELRTFIDTPLAEAVPSAPAPAVHTAEIRPEQLRNPSHIEGLRRIQKAAKGSTPSL
jgi:integrase